MSDYSLTSKRNECTFKMNNVELTLTFERHLPDGRGLYAYVFTVDGVILFQGNDYTCPTFWDSLSKVCGLLGFLTLRPGDTDREYFAKYSQDQMDWTKTQLCESLSCFVFDLEPVD